MKWKNFDCGPCYYYITSTFTEWMPVFRYKEALQIVREEITRATEECGAHISAYVFMPTHLHLLSYLPSEGLLHRYCKLWRGRSARRITLFLTDLAAATPAGVSAFQCRNEPSQNGPTNIDPWTPTCILARMAAHANGTATYTVWKEQPRSLPIWSGPKLREKVDYIHENPCRKKLVVHPGEWPFSSWRYYEGDGKTLLPIQPFPA